MPINEVRKANNFKLIHARGTAVTQGKLEDERFELGFENVVKLRRKVEMLQWFEVEKTDEAIDEASTRYKYEKRWSQSHNESEGFFDDTYKNPPSMPIET